MENILEFYPEVKKELEYRQINLIEYDDVAGEGQVIATLKRYFLLAELIKPEIPFLLEEDEIQAVFSALANTVLDKYSIIINLAHEVDAACLYEHVDKFSNIDGKQLVKKLEAMPTYFYFAIVDALKEWRFNTMYSDTPSDRSIYSYFQGVSKKDTEVYL